MKILDLNKSGINNNIKIFDGDIYGIGKIKYKEFLKLEFVLGEVNLMDVNYDYNHGREWDINFPELEKIKGNLDLEQTLASMKKLKYVGGNVYSDCVFISDSLEEVGGKLEVYTDEINLNKLKKVGGNLIIHNEDFYSNFNCLNEIGGILEIENNEKVQKILDKRIKEGKLKILNKKL